MLWHDGLCKEGGGHLHQLHLHHLQHPSMGGGRRCLPTIPKLFWICTIFFQGVKVSELGDPSFAFSPHNFLKGDQDQWQGGLLHCHLPLCQHDHPPGEGGNTWGYHPGTRFDQGSYSTYNCDHRVSSTTSSRTGPSWTPSRFGVCTDAAGQILSSLSAGNATMPTLQQGPQGQFQIILGFFLVITLERVICVCNILTFNREKAVWVSADIVEKLCSHKRKRQDCARGVGYCWAGECWKIAFMKPCNL